MARLKDAYVKDVAPALMKKFSYKSVMQIPKLDKVVINVGCGEARDNPKIMDAILSDLAKITGQKAVVCRAKKSVANFKLREGMPIGAKVTLRGERMYEFVDRFFSVALPRVRDFRGINGNSFDGRGNYSCGVKAVSYTHLDVYKRQQHHKKERKTMAIKKYKPTTPGRRGMTVTDYSALSKVAPERSLLEPMKKAAGRNNTGRITCLLYTSRCV